MVEQPADLRARRSRWRAAARSGRGSGPRPRRRPARRTSWSVRVSCQLIALCTGAPVARSHSTVVSRWLVMPSATRSRRRERRRRRAPAATTCWTLRQISIGSCSTQPGPREHAAVLPLADRDEPRRARRRRCSGRRRCPGRPTRRSARSRPFLPPSRVTTVSRRGRGTRRAPPRARTTRGRSAARRCRSSRSTGPEMPIAPDRDAAAVLDRRGDRRPPRRTSSSTSSAHPRSRRRRSVGRQRVAVGDRRRRVAAAGPRRPARPPRSGWRRAAPCPCAVACAGSSAPTSSAWRLSSGRKTWWTTSTRPSCSVPIRTLSPLRAASASDQLIARVRSSLTSR